MDTKTIGIIVAVIVVAAGAWYWYTSTSLPPNTAPSAVGTKK